MKYLITIFGIAALMTAGYLGFRFLTIEETAEPAFSPTTTGQQPRATIDPLSPGTYVAYAEEDADDQESRIILFDIDRGKSTVLYRARPSSQRSVIFGKYDETSFSALGVDADRDSYIRIALDGTVTQNPVGPNEYGFLWSPDATRIAYTAWDGTAFDFVVRTLPSGGELRIPTGERDGVQGSYHPLLWTTDGTIYANYQVPTEGYPVGLYAFAADTLTVTRVPAVDEQGLIQLSMDADRNIYGIREEGYDPYSRAFPSTIVKIAIADGTVKEYVLPTTFVEMLKGVSPDGRFLAYTYSPEDGASDLWLYDMERGVETRMTDGAVVSQEVHWNDSKLLFLAEERMSDGTPVNRVIVTNAATGDADVVDEGSSAALGWFVVPE